MILIRFTRTYAHNLTFATVKVRINMHASYIYAWYIFLGIISN
jgi:hypothetical protein